MTPPAKDLWEDLMCNTMLYGTGFLKMQKNEQDGFDMSIVPIEDYQYIDSKFNKTAQQAERQAVLDTIDALQGMEDRHPLFVEGYEYALRQIEEFIKGRT